MPFRAINNDDPLTNIYLPRGQIQAMRLILDFVKCKHFLYKTEWINITKIPVFVEEMHAKIGVGMTRRQRDYVRKKRQVLRSFSPGKTV